MIAFCGVWFMAETAKVLNPDRIVVVPDREASCSLVDSCPVEPIRELPPQASRPRHRQLHQYVDRSEGGERHPVHVAQRREGGQLDSRRRRPMLFLPDINLGNYVQQQTGRENMKIWQGACIVHATFPARRAGEAQAGASRAPRWWRIPSARRTVLAMADFIGSTSAHHRMVRAQATPQEFIVMTESGVNYSLETRRARARSSTSSPTKTAIAASART